MTNSYETRATVVNLLTGYGVTFSARYLGEAVRDGDWKYDHYRVRFNCFETDFYQGIGLRTKPKQSWAEPRPVAPKAADVLYCLLSDADALDMSFPDWCDNFGYDTDSKKANATYDRCCATAKELRRVFKPEQLQALREALQDF